MKDKVEEVAEVVRRIPAGNVSTYGEVAKAAGCHARYVGWVMKKAESVPWWRVVRADGSSHAPELSIPYWEEEEISHSGARVDMRRHGLDAADLKRLG